MDLVDSADSAMDLVDLADSAMDLEAMDLEAMVSDMATTTTTSLAKRRWRSW